MITVVTPSLQQSEWLKLCVASVADQAVEVEHIVQDAGSKDGTLDWLITDPRVRAFIEKDGGMYDAVDRGLRRAKGEILAYLNCDEQYLPGALSAVEKFFEAHPGVDVVFGDVIMVDGKGDYLWHRKMQTPLKYHTWTCHLSTLTCATFFRRRIYFDLGFQFDTRWRDAGDAEWMVRMLNAGVGVAALGRFTSTFTQTGANMSAAENARRENRALRRTAPGWARALRPGLIVHHRIRRWLGGMYKQEPFQYAIYTPGSREQRQTIVVDRPRFRP